MIAGSGCKVSATADWLAVGAVDSELVSGVNSLIYSENTGKSPEYGDPGAARLSNFASISGPRR
jgi:hypothetical protein